MEGSSSLTIESKILGKGLRNAELKALVDEIADSPGVVLEVTRCKTLIGTVEKREVFLFANELGKLLPLFTGWVNASGVVGAGMQEDDTSFWCRGYCGLHTRKVEAFGLSGEIGISLDWEGNI